MQVQEHVINIRFDLLTVEKESSSTSGGVDGAILGAEDVPLFGATEAQLYLPELVGMDENKRMRQLADEKTAIGSAGRGLGNVSVYATILLDSTSTGRK